MSCMCPTGWAPHGEYDIVSLLRRGKDQEFCPSVGSVRQLLMSSLHSLLYPPEHWHPLHVCSQGCPEKPRGGGSENHFSVTGGGWVSGWCHPFLRLQVSNRVWPVKETHRHDSHTLGPGQSPNYSLLWDSPYNGSFCFEKPSEQLWV